MNAALVALALVTGCSASARDACEQSIQCEIDRDPDAPQPSEEDFDTAVEQCIAGAQTNGVPQECFDCIASHSCEEIFERACVPACNGDDGNGTDAA